MKPFFHLEALMMTPERKMQRCSPFLLLSILFTGCQVINAPVNDESAGEIYRPPTAAISNQAAQIPAPSQPGNDGHNALAQQPSCTNNLVYFDDLTIPDGTEVPPGALLDKQWIVENKGTCNWGENYRLKLISGSELSAQAEQALYPARSGTRPTIRILFTAPQEAGNYHSAWQAYSPTGEPFGDPVFIEIAVVEGTASP
jgi:hypothetical protein